MWIGHLTAGDFGCGRAIFGVQTREKDDFIDFLWKDEGLRASRESNVMAHEYFGVDSEILWEALRGGLPPLAPKLEAIL